MRAGAPCSPTTPSLSRNPRPGRDWADGGLRSAEDALKLICLGANRLGFGTASMVAIGCTICRGCQLDSCHVGIATQIEDEHEAHERGLKRSCRASMRAPPKRSCAFSPRWAKQCGRAQARWRHDIQDLVGQANHLVQVSHHDRLTCRACLTPVRERVITAPEGKPDFSASSIRHRHTAPPRSPQSGSRQDPLWPSKRKPRPPRPEPRYRPCWHDRPFPHPREQQLELGRARGWDGQRVGGQHGGNANSWPTPSTVAAMHRWWIWPLPRVRPPAPVWARSTSAESDACIRWRPGRRRQMRARR